MPLKTNKWNLTLSLNISRSMNKVIELPDHQPVVRENVLDNGKFMSLVNEGDQVGTIYGLRNLEFLVVTKMPMLKMRTVISLQIFRAKGYLFVGANMMEKSLKEVMLYTMTSIKTVLLINKM